MAIENKEEHIENTRKELASDLTRLLDHMDQPSYHKHDQKSYRLVAVSGDLSAAGMHHKATIVEVPNGQFETVDRLVQLQEAFAQDDIFAKMMTLGYERGGGALAVLWDRYDQIRTEIIEAVQDTGLFRDKYHFRTTWAWIERPEFDHERYEAAERVEEPA